MKFPLQLESRGAGHVYHQRAHQGHHREDDLIHQAKGVIQNTVIITNGAIMLKESSNHQERGRKYNYYHLLRISCAERRLNHIFLCQILLDHPVVVGARASTTAWENLHREPWTYDVRIHTNVRGRYSKEISAQCRLVEVPKDIADVICTCPLSSTYHCRLYGQEDERPEWFLSLCQKERRNCKLAKRANGWEKEMHFEEGWWCKRLKKNYLRARMIHFEKRWCREA